MMRSKSIFRIAIATALMLLLPLLAMQITDEVAWDPADFAVAGILLFGTGLMYELIAKKEAGVAYRLAVGVSLATALLLVWTNLAVGVIGSEGEPANRMYFGVLAVGLVGAIVARFRPRGMAHALSATALAQALAAGIALIAEMHRHPGSSVPEILWVNGFFVALFLGSALLFRRADRRDGQTKVGRAL